MQDIVIATQFISESEIKQTHPGPADATKHKQLFFLHILTGFLFPLPKKL